MLFEYFSIEPVPITLIHPPSSSSLFDPSTPSLTPQLFDPPSSPLDSIDPRLLPPSTLLNSSTYTTPSLCTTLLSPSSTILIHTAIPACHPLPHKLPCSSWVIQNLTLATYATKTQ